MKNKNNNNSNTFDCSVSDLTNSKGFDNNMDNINKARRAR